MELLKARDPREEYRKLKFAISDEVQVGLIKYRVGDPVGRGFFGIVLKGTNSLTDETVAMKFEEKVGEGHTKLEWEWWVYLQLRGCESFPKLIDFDEVNGYDMLIMGLLGQSLKAYFKECNRYLDLSTVRQMGVEMLNCLEELHKRHLIHRDVKPDNYVFGKPGTAKAKNIQLLDFGFSKRYRDHQTKLHIPYRTGKTPHGTARYLSLNAHRGEESSRRDDVESVIYVLLYFLCLLTWEKLKDTKQIEQEKEKMDLEELPCPFGLCLEYARGMEFDEAPDYDYLRKLLTRTPD